MIISNKQATTFKTEVINYVNESDKQWYTVTLCNNENLVSVYQGSGLDMDRDKIDSNDLNDDYIYFEIESEQLNELLKSDKLTFMLMDF